MDRGEIVGRRGRRSQVQGLADRLKPGAHRLDLWDLGPLRELDPRGLDLSGDADGRNRNERDQ
jgi:hypothetical protein